MDVLMPQLGETVAEGTLTIWHKAVGDTVENGELLFEIGTDKVEMEVPAPISGVLTVINVEAGSTVDVGAVLAVIDDGTSDAASCTAVMRRHDFSGKTRRWMANPTAKNRKYSSATRFAPNMH